MNPLGLVFGYLMANVHGFIHLFIKMFSLMSSLVTGTADS